ncbi:MAG: vitamin K epoxide reductase family protein, partial [Fuerstia sp.]|nr:vitamin K epoxide reductase family protein [Fuerstiella sp.]
MQPSFDNADVGTSDALSSMSAELPTARFVWSLRLICAAALGISVYLAWTAFSMGSVFGCSGGDLIDCEHVLTSHWSKVMGIPVSVPAAGLYASLIALLAFARQNGPSRLRQLVWGGMTLGSVMAGLAALWFIGLQLFEFKFCPYCLVVHTCGIVLTGTMLASRCCPLPLKLKSASVSVFGIAALVGIQVATPKADHFEIVHYDHVAPAGTNGEGDAVEVSGTDVFEAPGDVFEAPGEVFEPPVAGDVAVESGSVGADSAAADESAKPEDPKPSDKPPSVAATLLLISPPRLLQLTHLLLLTLPQPADESAKSTDAAKVEDTKE